MTGARPERAIAVTGALVGGTGVALAAAAAHLAGGGTLDIAARFLLFHAPALLALAGLVWGGFAHQLLGRLSAAALAVGVVLFSGDLAWRVLSGPTPLPSAAPTGGVLMIIGWALAALAVAAGGNR